MSDSISANATGATRLFQVKDGQVYDPAGKVFRARGIAVNASAIGDANQILADFPGLNFVRLTVYDYQSPDTYAAFVKTMTSHGIVVEFEDHTSSDGTNGGGARGSAFTGQLLTNELNWYSSVAKAYALNPYVWFGTNNEPPFEGISAWHQQTYDAIRNVGNLNPIMIDLPGAGYPYLQSLKDYGMDPAVYATMSNVLVDIHLYGWSSHFAPDLQAVSTALADLARGGQDMMTADGRAPVIIGEYGISTDGEKVDANANQVLQVAQHSSLVGASAFTWSGSGADTLTDGQGHLNAYGKQVAQWIASGSQPAASGSPPPTGATVSQSDLASYTISDTGMALIAGPNDPADGTAGTGAGGGGAIYVLPAAGAAPVSFADDILNAGATLDLTGALAATDWNGAGSTLPDFLTVTDTSAGAVISIATSAGGQGTAVATIPGVTGLTVDTLLAHSIT